MPSLCLVLNPKAAADQALRADIEEMRADGVGIQVRLTWEAGDATRFAHEAADAGVDIVVAAGGDGTINEVVNGLLQSERECGLGVMPYGTANDFATSLGLANFTNPNETLALIPFAEPRMIDIGMINERAFINVATGGFGAEITTSTPAEAKTILGGAAYLLSGLADLSRIHPIEIDLDGDFTWSGGALAVCIGNGTQTGGGRRVTPLAELDDGKLDIAIVPELPTNRIISLLRDGEHWPDADDVVYEQVQEIQLRSKSEFQFNLDGEPMRDTEFSIRVLADRIPLYA